MIYFIKRRYHNLVHDEKFSEILTGSIWALSARLLAAAFGLIASIIVARVYGAEMVGIVAVVNSFLMLTSIFTVLGTDTSILRLIPEHLTKHSPRSAFMVYRKTQYLVICASLAMGAFFFLVAGPIADRVFVKPHLTFYFSLSAVFIVFRSLMLLNTSAVRGLRHIRMFAFMQMLPQAGNLFLLLLIGVLISKKDVPVYAQLGAYALAGLAGWGIMTHDFKRKVGANDEVHPLRSREILSISLPMFMTAAMAFIIGETGVLLLGVFRSEAEVGHYAIAVKLATMTSFILTAINSMAAPKFSELFHSGKIDELFHVAKKSAKLIFWSTTPILLGFAVFGKPVLRIVFGSGFVVAYPALVLLVVGQFVNSISGATGYFMNMTGHQAVLRNIMLVVGVLNIAISFALIPKCGINGAAVAAMVSIVAWNSSTLLYIKLKFGKTTGYFPVPVFL